LSDPWWLGWCGLFLAWALAGAPSLEARRAASISNTVVTVAARLTPGWDFLAGKAPRKAQTGLW
jgi:hypothetical protein